MSDLSSRLRSLRKERAFTQKQMAAEFEVSEILWRQYESGKRTPTFDGFLALADYFNVSLDYLAGLSDDPARR